MGADASMEKRLSPEELNKLYKHATRFTTGVVFGQGDARLGPEVRDEVIRRRRAREAKAKRIADKAKKKLRELAEEVEEIKWDMEQDPSFPLEVKELEKLVRWKTRKGDGKLPKLKTDLERRWEEIKGRELPQISPHNTEDEEDEHD